MEQYEASTVEMDSTGFDSLQNQILNKNSKTESNQDIREKLPEKAPESAAKKSLFKRGDQTFEIDDDYELEFMADKELKRLTLRELKDRASGDIAIKNRMHSLAEEKKRVSSTFKRFSEIAKTDPLGALEYISNQTKETDSEFEYAKYIEKLAEQAEKLGRMTEDQRKQLELEKKLAKAEQDLSQKEREDAVVLRKQEILSDYPEIGHLQFDDMVNAVLQNDKLMEGLETEDDVIDQVEELIQETLTQNDIMSVIKQINPAYLNNHDLIFSLSNQLKQNPDLDEEDVREIIRELIGTNQSTNSPTQKERDVRTLSNKARESSPMNSLKNQNATPYDLLAQKLMESKKELSRTPLYMR